jgi:hypothetical protein
VTITSTVTRSASTTMTAARVRNVMLEVGADFVATAVAGLATYEVCEGWRIDLTYLLEQGAVERFQIQFVCDGYAPLALEFVVSGDGTLQSTDKAGGIDYFRLVPGTRARLLVSLNYQANDVNLVLEYLRRRGWGFNGQAVTGSGTRDRVYASEGYGVVRSKIGAW